MKKNLNNIEFEGKKVLLRVDFNVPMDDDGNVTDYNRIKAALPTIKYLLKNKAKVIAFSHLGKVKKEEDLSNKSLAPVAKILEEKIGEHVSFSNKIEGYLLEEKIEELREGEILLVENTRFADITEADGTINLKINRESGNDPILSKYWASLGDVFVNDAFGTCHRSHASNVGIASNIEESCLGYLVEKEYSMLSKILDNPEKPYIAIVGGAKVSDKINVIEELMNKADKILIVGGMAFTFLKALNYNVGTSLLEQDKIELAKKYLNDKRAELILPVDSAISKTFSDSIPEFTEDQNVPEGCMGLDIGPKSIQLFKENIEGAKTIFWNGPAGVCEFENYCIGTEEICRTIVEQKDAFSVIGGGDSAAAAIKLGYEHKFSHISTGGGASLELLEGKKLPGVECIQDISK